MATCEKCWGAANGREMLIGGNVAGHYADLIAERKDNPCTPEEQAGTSSGLCPKCDRHTVHQYAGECTICGWGNRDGE